MSGPCCSILLYKFSKQRKTQQANFLWRCLEASLFDIWTFAFLIVKASENRPNFYNQMSMDPRTPNKAAIRVPMTRDIRGHPIEELLNFSYVWVINEFSKERSPPQRPVSQDANSNGSRRTCPFLYVNRTSKVILRRQSTTNDDVFGHHFTLRIPLEFRRDGNMTYSVFFKTVLQILFGFSPLF